MLPKTRNNPREAAVRSARAAGKVAQTTFGQLSAGTNTWGRENHHVGADCSQLRVRAGAGDSRGRGPSGPRPRRTPGLAHSLLPFVAADKRARAGKCDPPSALRARGQDRRPVEVVAPQHDPAG